MGEAARDVLFRRTGPGDRLDMAVALSEAYIDAFLAGVVVPEDTTPEERARIHFRALRGLRR